MVGCPLGYQSAYPFNRVYRALHFAPNKRLSLRFVLPGAVFAAAGWIIVSMLFSFYVGTFANYSATYGSIGELSSL